MRPRRRSSQLWQTKKTRRACWRWSTSRSAAWGSSTLRTFAWGVALVAPQDPGNLGTILRTVDAVGASGLLLLDSSVDLYHPSAVRASMGAMFWLPVVSTSFADFVAWSRGHGYHVYGTSAHAPVDYQDVPAYAWPRILLLGSERQGLTEEQTESLRCDGSPADARARHLAQPGGSGRCDALRHAGALIPLTQVLVEEVGYDRD